MSSRARTAANNLLARACKYLTERPRTTEELQALGVGLAGFSSLDENDDEAPLPTGITPKRLGRVDPVDLASNLFKALNTNDLVRARALLNQLVDVDPRIARNGYAVLERLEAQQEQLRAKRLRLEQQATNEMTELQQHPRIALHPESSAYRVCAEGVGPLDD